VFDENQDFLENYVATNKKKIFLFIPKNEGLRLRIDVVVFLMMDMSLIRFRLDA
jgi:hypothetical protein